MKIEIWSDVLCPFCYIGKRNLERALALFDQKEEVEITWKSFELDPSAPKNQQRNLDEVLARKYGRTREAAFAMNQQMTENAKRAGLEFHLDQAIPTNSFDAHRLIQLAKEQGFADRAEETLFAAYLTQGLDIADHATLLRLAVEIGLDPAEVQQMLSTDQFSQNVREDEEQAYEIGIQGVPFFLFEEKYTISGAQPSENFLQALQQIWEQNKAAEEESVPSPS
jgi:predicted DsbA family dithiol-disulfide isomerase